jgi:hypothetical protein
MPRRHTPTTIEVRDGREFRVTMLPARSVSKARRSAAKRTGRYRSDPYKEHAPQRGGTCRWCSHFFTPGEPRLTRVTEGGRILDCCHACGRERGYKVLRPRKPKRHKVHTHATPESLETLAAHFGGR